MDKATKMMALCNAYQTLCGNPMLTDSERQCRESIAGRIDDLTRDIILAEEPTPANTKHRKDTHDDTIPF